MNDRILYEPKEIETKPLDRKIMVHGAMNYECEVCGKSFLMWLEKGLEDKVSDALTGQHKPVPFTIACLCGGIAKHVRWHDDIRLGEYAELKENMSYFGNEEDCDCGVSHIRTDGEKCYSYTTNMPKIKPIIELEEEPLYVPTYTNDDPYGLAHVSTTKLKAELRRRKKW